MGEVPVSRLARLEGRVAAWLDGRRRERLLQRLGGTQRCPWCRQGAQDGEGWRFDPYGPNPVHDVLTCGVCRGTSVWHFAMGFVPVAPLAPPPPDPGFPNRVSWLGAPASFPPQQDTPP